VKIRFKVEAYCKFCTYLIPTASPTITDLELCNCELREIDEKIHSEVRKSDYTFAGLSISYGGYHRILSEPDNHGHA
jgi:hypothetical protein